MYHDTYLHMVGFPGEYFNDGSVLVVKTHYDVNKTMATVQFESIVLLIRNPRDSILVFTVSHHSLPLTAKHDPF